MNPCVHCQHLQATALLYYALAQSGAPFNFPGDNIAINMHITLASDEVYLGFRRHQ